MTALLKGPLKERDHGITGSCGRLENYKPVGFYVGRHRRYLTTTGGYSDSSGCDEEDVDLSKLTACPKS